ncbi:membrane fusion protein, multidrug efflux system [Bradyrhizobium lablabi]|uniref:Membrane fusion protein, multidrug efflux system n=1 Tax=Bradyrhizobium lablabi TaxID=722472 RepID=A0A1M6VKZ4_9BRAD|nr:HlyD family secretion protein [Bradyrhizobium lablabi]SHK82170.1 membrane fusion protein, multidrug efflux system [Bradyrhizobium lablabi]
MLKRYDEQTLREVESPRFPPGSPDGPADEALAHRSPQKEKPETEAPSSRERPAGEPPSPELPAETDDQPAPGGVSSGESRKGFRRRHPIAALVGSALLVLAVGAGYAYWNYASDFESTDDAFIAARQIAIAPKVTGYVTQVPVTDNQHVAAGAVIARIDDRDYRIALEQASAQVAAAQATIQNIDAQVAVQQAQIKSSEAQVEQAQATLVFAQQQSARYETLARNGAGTVQNAQQYSSQLLQQQAALKSAQAALTVAQRQIESLKAQRSSAEASLAQAVAQRDQAQLNLSYTTVTAAQAGRVVNLTASAGEFAQAGTNLTMFVPDEIWVTANFKETQLNSMRPGQPASMRIDAYPKRAIRGHVASVQPGSGTAFSLLPAENATGNYVKVIQRVPVKIIIDNPPTDVALGPGMSVVPSVRINFKPSLYERLASSIDYLWRQS